MNIMNFATQSVITVEPEDSIDKAISLMEEHSIHHLVVALDQRPIGMVSDRDILISCGWMLSVERCVLERGGDAPTVVGPTRVEQIMSRPLVTLSQSDSAEDAALLFLHRKFSAVPIVARGRLAGLLTETDLLRWLDELGFGGNAADRLLSAPVREMMRSRVVCLEPNALIDEVIGIFRRHRVRHVPVALHGAIMGMISDRDVRRCLGLSSVYDLESEIERRIGNLERLTTASDIMQTKLETIEPVAPAREALRRMLDRRIHSLPVVDDGRLAGIVTQTDFVKGVVRGDLL